VLRLLARYTLLALAVLLLNFFLPRLLPGDPLDFSANAGALATSTLSADARAHLRATYHLDQPLPDQLRTYLSDLAHADLGWSISRSAPVAELIGSRLPWTLGLVATAVLLAGLGGSGLGLLAAWRGGRAGWLVVGAASVLAALPEFLLAMALLLALAVGLRWFPLQGGQNPFGDAGINLPDVAWHLTLPALTLVLATSGAFVLLTRGAVLNVREEPYLTAARARGVGELQVALRHALPNAVLPVLTLFGVRLGQVFGGAIVVERVFAVPGLGLLSVEAIRARDYPVLQAVFLLASLGVLAVNLVLELAYSRLEPRRP
jgi:peptide/nickel transport system permease protein